MVVFVLLFYNLSISISGISKTIPSYTIMTRKVLGVKQDCKHRFGEYVQANANVPANRSNNNDVLQSIQALATPPMCKNQGTK